MGKTHTYDDRLKTFGNMVAMERERYDAGNGKIGITQAELAEMLGVDLDKVRNWEQGNRFPKFDDLMKLCSVFKCGVDHLLNKMGDTDYKTWTNKYICEQTGLSEEVVEMFVAFGYWKRTLKEYKIDIDNQNEFNAPPFVTKEQGQFIMESRDIRYFINCLADNGLLYDLLNCIREYLTINMSSDNGVICYNDTMKNTGSFQKSYNSLDELQIIPSRKNDSEYLASVSIDQTLLKLSKLRQIQDILDDVST